ncbi:MAG: DUF2281 domain-containing protein, partial [Kiritimatiellae bacterium]|nr:DUF2281 domain-containing protein [Kiritimatiellia bacterium]
MPAIRTFVTPVNGSVTVHIPEEYRSYSLEVIVLPIMNGDDPFQQHSFDRLRDGKKRKLGGFEDGFRMSPDFDEPLADFAEYM